MTTLTGIVASVVMHSSAAAFSHFGMTLEPAHADRPAAPERVVARSHALTPQKLADCPERAARARVDRT